MKTHNLKSLISCLTLIAAIGVPSVSNAGPIVDSASGSYGFFTIGTTTYSDGNLSAAMAPGAMPISPNYTVSSLGIGLSTFTTNPGPVGLPASFIVTGTGTDAGNFATFTILGSSGTLTDNLDETGKIRATFQLVNSNLMNFEFGPGGTLYDFILSYQFLTFTPGGGGGSVTGNGLTSSYSISRQALGPLPFPEPTSMLAWGLIILAGGTYRLRSRLSSKATA